MSFRCCNTIPVSCQLTKKQGAKENVPGTNIPNTHQTARRSRNQEACILIESHSPYWLIMALKHPNALSVIQISYLYHAIA